MVKAGLLGIALAAATLAQDVQVQKFALERATTDSVMVRTKEVTGAPYSATAVTESTQALADGNRIVNRTEGTVARDSQGRTRNETALPAIGNMTSKAARMVVISDPVTGTNYSLNTADKTYRKLGVVRSDMKQRAENVAVAVQAGTVSHTAVMGEPMHIAISSTSAGMGDMMTAKVTAEHVQKNQMKTESLGLKVFDGVSAEGTRITRTIPAGEIGNEKPIEIVTETWFSRDLGTIVYSKRSDPRTGETTFSLTNINRAEPDASLFVPPADYKESRGAGGERVCLPSRTSSQP